MDTEKKNPNSYPRVMFRLNKELKPLLIERTREKQTLEQTVRRDLERYYEMLRRSLPMFSVGEAMLICDVMNGTINQSYSVHHLWAEISDALEEGYAEKWNVDGPALVKRLRSLTPLECMAIADAVERAWNSPTYQVKDFEGRVRQTGLIREED